MRKRSQTIPDSANKTEFNPTCGEVFQDGDSQIELVQPHGAANPQLLLSDNGRITIAPQVEYGGQLFRPVDLDPGFLQLIRLPSAAEEYGTFGALLSRIRDMCRGLTGLAEDDAHRVVCWIFTTWFSPMFLCPPVLLLFGRDMQRALQMLRFLRNVTRHSFIATDMRKPALRALVERFEPTLLLNEPRMHGGTLRFLQASNHCGLGVLDTSGRAAQIACSKALFMGSDLREDLFEGAAVKLILPSGLSTPDVDETIAAELTSGCANQLLMYRLRNYSKLCRTRREHGKATMESWVTAETESDSDSDPIQSLDLIARPAREAIALQQFLDPRNAIVEVLWPWCHQPGPGVRVQEITQYVNTLLCARGETKSYSPEEIGRLLETLSLERRRKNSGMYVERNSTTKLRLHNLALYSGLGSAVPDCSECRTFGVGKTQIKQLSSNSEGNANLIEHTGAQERERSV